MKLTNFTVRKLTNAHGELALAKEKFASKEFISSDDIWLASFEVDGVKREAGVRRGRRIDVAEDTDMVDVQLRVGEAEFDADTFIPESQVAEITKAVYEEFLNGEYWDRP
jgi:hypothetical protein